MLNHSGKFVLRVEPKLHTQLVETAKKNKISLNQLCNDVLAKYYNVKENEEFPQGCSQAVDLLKGRFKDTLLCIVLFGSYATGEKTEASDIDLFVILDKGTPIARDLYSWWDDKYVQNGNAIINPHFVALSEKEEDASGIWFEVAQSGKVLYQNGTKAGKLLQGLKVFIEEGRVRKQWSNGHPYWVRRDK